MAKKVTSKSIICLCNCVALKDLEIAISKGATSLDAIFAKTSAGIGACGGSCRPFLEEILEYYKLHGRVPHELKRNRGARQG